MIETETVLNDFINISGLSKSDAMKHKNLILISIAHLENNLKPNIDIKKNNYLLSMLAASIAYHKFVLVKESLNSTSSVKLGDVSISSQPSYAISFAKNLENEFLHLASHLLLSHDFIFKQV